MDNKMNCCTKLCCSRVSQRWIFAVMGSLAVVNVYTMRICLSIAITEMVTSVTTSNDTRINAETCPAFVDTSSISRNGGTYEWTEYTQGVILSSFFWGYITTQIPGGILAAKFGGKYILGFGIFSTAILTCLTPIVVEAYDATGLIVLRIMMGMGEGIAFPAVYALIAQWAPPRERSVITSVVMTGSQIGSVMGTALSGVLIQYSSIGWPLVFYVFGAIGILWCLIWVVLCYSHPDVNPFITEKEKKYLHEAMNEHTHRKIKPMPWRHILTSIPVWALIIGKGGREWGFQIMVTDLPKYMSNVLKFSIEANGFLSALPNLTMWVIGIVSSWIADWLIKGGQISLTNVRKMFTTISSMGSAVFIILASYAGCDHTLVVILFTISMGLMGSCYSGIMSNMLDLSPNYSGILMAMLNVMGATCGMLVPYMVGVLTPNQGLLEWRVAFWITFVIFCVTTLVFNVWGDGEVQYWNDLDLHSQAKSEKRIDELELKEPLAFPGNLVRTNETTSEYMK